MTIIKIFLIGWAVLFIAIFLNIIAAKLNILTWYPFFENIEKYGFIKSFRDSSFISKLFLFIIYPFLLGIAGFIGYKLLKL